MMTESRRYVPARQLDLEQIRHEARQRWLRPVEICEILRNYQKFHLAQDPPNRPPAGSLFLFDRKALRYFRKDGHRWRKKKDGKTVKEAHEKLKAGSVDVLHCYYAHGEDNESFQRRSYWLLDGQLEHIVLVHYRELKEGYRSCVSRLLSDPGSQTQSRRNDSAPSFARGNSPAPSVLMSHASSTSMIDWNGQTLSSEFEDVDSVGGLGALSVAKPMYGSILQSDADPGPEHGGFPELTENASASSAGDRANWPEGHNKFHIEEPGGSDFMGHTKLDASGIDPNIATSVDRLNTDVAQDSVTISYERVTEVPQENDLCLTHSGSQNCSGQRMIGSSEFQIVEKGQDTGVNNDASGGLKKLDSFGRWMDKEIGGDCDGSLMASDSGKYWNTVDTENDKEVSSLTQHMQLDSDALGPSLSQEQLFSIIDFSPDWGFAGVETKVLIVGTFLGSKKPSSTTKWGCMFGEVEVSAQVLTDNVIQCQAPSHDHRRVPFYVTCSDRLACSEVREFEYRAKPLGMSCSKTLNYEAKEETRLQIHLARLLYIDPEKKWSDCSSKECEGCKLKRTIYSTRSIDRKNWETVKDTSGVSSENIVTSKDELVETLLKDRLCEWLVYKVHEGGKGPNVLDDEGLGAIHLVASLGYEWAIRPIISAGVNLNFRDGQGRTALHWAAEFGREETIIALIKLGAAPGAVDDPSSVFPGGQTAADLASSRGYKGIAGYLAEADLTSHLSSLTINQNMVDNVSANFAAEKAVHTTAQVVVPSNSTLEEQIALKGSLAAVKNSARVAALIQAAFRARSFRHRQLSKSNDESSEASLDLVTLGSLKKVQKMSHFEDYLHSAALKIQQKYRGWKGRKEFLKTRNRIVKIQAHVRGRQVRKQYKKVVWSVSIVEKAILRWRRKGAGLRGFKVKNPMISEAQGIEKADEYEFLRIGRKQKFAGVEKALERVKSMVRQPEAREQYMRLVSKFENFQGL